MLRTFTIKSDHRRWSDRLFYLATTLIVARVAMSEANESTKLDRTKNRRKREADSPAEGEGKDLKRPNQTSSQISAKQETDSTVTPLGNMEDALLDIAATVDECISAHGDTVPTLNAHSDLLFKSNEEIKELRRENERLTKRLDNLEIAQKSTREKICEVEQTANSNAHLLKNANIVIEGIVETADENCRTIAHDIFKAIEKDSKLDHVISAYRIGNSSENSKIPRPMIVKLKDPLMKATIMESKWKLIKHEKFNKAFLNDDLPPAIKKERRVLREICKFAHQQGYRGCKASGSKLVVEGKAYRYNTLHLLPYELQLCNVKTRKVGDGLGFQGEESFLSNFYPTSLTMEGITFCCSSEQAYQFFKTRTCKRDDRSMKILDILDG